jgi:hypothetical protein
MGTKIRNQTFRGLKEGSQEHEQSVRDVITRSIQAHA